MDNDIESLVQAAEQGDAEAQYSLGIIYANGNGVQKDMETANYWLAKAVAQGHAGAIGMSIILKTSSYGKFGIIGAFVALALIIALNMIFSGHAMFFINAILAGSFIGGIINFVIKKSCVAQLIGCSLWLAILVFMIVMLIQGCGEKQIDNKIYYFLKNPNKYVADMLSGSDTAAVAEKQSVEDAEEAKISNMPQKSDVSAEPEKRAEEKTLDVFADARDGKKYNIVKIGSQTWMAENLNYNAKGSKCYDNNTGNCKIYGRLYNWATAKTACPAGWHLPSEGEWETLANNAGSSAGKKLKASDGWSGANTYGFSALPGGLSDKGKFSGAGNLGLWWSATEYDSGYALRYIMDREHNNMDKFHNEKTRLLSVRCLED